MCKSIAALKTLGDLPIWEKRKIKNIPSNMILEITARCNNNCRHCYINLPANHKGAQKKELTFEEIKKFVDEAVDRGVVFCTLTGGEPLLRNDFIDIYLYLKRRGLLVSINTNGTLLSGEHIQIFRKYPPWNIEVTVYGVAKETYEGVTRKNGSFVAFKRGLGMLYENRIKVRLKTMALRSNVHELNKIAKFCRESTKDYFRFDPFLNLRYDKNHNRNMEIKSERLSSNEIVDIEGEDPERSEALKKNCGRLIVNEFSEYTCNHLFHCEAGRKSFAVSFDGTFHLCASLWHPDTIYDLRKGNLAHALSIFIPKVLDIRSNKKDFLRKCRVCPIINLCFWCPANAYLETGEMDSPVNYFCRVAHARAQRLVEKN